MKSEDKINERDFLAGFVYAKMYDSGTFEIELPIMWTHAGITKEEMMEILQRLKMNGYIYKSADRPGMLFKLPLREPEVNP